MSSLEDERSFVIIQIINNLKGNYKDNISAF